MRQNLSSALAKIVKHQKPVEKKSPQQPASKEPLSYLDSYVIGYEGVGMTVIFQNVVVQNNGILNNVEFASYKMKKGVPTLSVMSAAAFDCRKPENVNQLADMLNNADTVIGNDTHKRTKLEMYKANPDVAGMTALAVGKKNMLSVAQKSQDEFPQKSAMTLLLS